MTLSAAQPLRASVFPEPGLDQVMGDVRFEPFGESVEDSDILQTPQDDFSRRLERVGMGIFWGLVGIVVVARALYFDPNIGARFAGGLPHTVGALLGAISLS